MPRIHPSVEHAWRRDLNDEVHARPPDSLRTPGSICYIARLPKRGPLSGEGKDLLGDLLLRFGQERPDRATNHFTTTLDDRRLRWERHTEYNRYTFVAGDASTDWQDKCIPEDWLEEMQGEVLVGVKARVIGPEARNKSIDELSADYFNGNTLIGSRIADNSAVALTDFRIHDDGFSRLLLINEDMSEQQTGRIMQRLLELETYRMMMLLALPLARALAPTLDEDEAELAAIGEALVDAESHHEQDWLDRLTRLSASNQARHQRSNYRFAASDAYYEIVLQRINELRETRIHGVQTFAEFTTRRLAPAVNTYRAVSQRQRSVLEQMARATKLLSTRIDISRQQQNQSLLESMNRRAKTQLRLQATIEGLSVAAVTYYVVGLIGTLAKGIASMGVPMNLTIVTAASIPIVAGLAFLGIHRLRAKISREADE
ncbi:MAG: DUF3422 domain-containing protein [Gammaproteobacteria bacterium]|nr:DUF3422 domain-containing protein [Gammaproteobacteria bacterium]MDH3480162.1 DUF3422 domain-containing protein [Gammaproteobacteria bacterium]